MSDDGYIVQRDALVAGQEGRQPWGWLGFFSDEASTGIEGVTVGMARIAPGDENPLHVHDNCAEIMLLLAGSIEHVVGVDVVYLSAGDVLIVPAGMPHHARNVGSDIAEMVVVYNSGRRGFEALHG
jgi:mannose-6-phosphate isomerase-like protein (cupin superfamily)